MELHCWWWWLVKCLLRVNVLMQSVAILSPKANTDAEYTYAVINIFGSRYFFFPFISLSIALAARMDASGI
jgi:hypothetical protein